MGKKHWISDKTQRIQMKAFICYLGLLLIAILLLGQIGNALLENYRTEEQRPHIPKIEVLTNVWIMESDEEGILVFRDGTEENYNYGSDAGRTKHGELLGAPYFPEGEVREQLADIELTDGAVTDIQLKTEKINGRILSADESFVEVEGLGKIPLDGDYKGYRIYSTLEMCTAKDLYIGYDFADLILDEGSICGILMVKEASMEAIRVLLKNADYGGIFHEQVVLTSDTDFTIQYGESASPLQEVHTAGEEIVIATDSGYFSGERIVIKPNVLTGKTILKTVNRSHGIPSYRGHIELLLTPDGIVVINQVLLEEYLYCVVPSEMPASYPNEALKAQAVCARTYAYGHMLQAGYPRYGAHVDDSTSYQVYNNILEQESTTTAVKETYGQLLYTEKGNLAGTYYYSTSCGVGSDAKVWKTNEAASIDYITAKNICKSAMTGEEASRICSDTLQENEAFQDFISAKDADDFEVTEGWYRWIYHVPQINIERLCTTLQNRYQVNPKLILTLEEEEYVSLPIEEFSQIQDMYISKRGAGGIADEMIIVTEIATYKVVSEHNIRYVLNDGETKVQRQDGSEVNSPNLLPSAFIALSIAKEKEQVTGYTLSGGGFGHGVGMSQNAAKSMAKEGYTARDILLFFYDNCEVKNVYEK